ncbi:MAG: hypothetical protein ACYC9K_01675 [Sulfuricaulis sp.]
MGILAWGSLLPIRDEILHGLDTDLISQAILDHKLAPLRDIMKSWDPKCKDHAPLSYAAGVIHDTLDDTLHIKLKTELVNTIADPNQKKRIDLLSSQLLTELIRKGYSEQFLYSAIKKCFFSDNKIKDIKVIESFLNDLDAKEKKYTVLVYSPRTSELLTRNADKDFVSHINSLKPRLHNDQAEKTFINSYEKGNIILEFREIEATDQFSARYIAEDRLKVATSFVGFLKHKLSIDNVELALVYEELRPPVACLVRQPTKATLKRPDIHQGMVDRTLVDMIGPIVSHDTDDVTKHRLLGSLRAHMAGTRASIAEDQFTNLWTALETLVGAQIGGNTIDAIQNKCIPVLCLKYFNKLLKSILQDIHRCIPDFFQSACSEREKNETNAQFLLRLLVTEKLKALRLRLYDACEQNPLLKQRIFRFHEIFCDPQKSYNLLDAHEKRLRWHLQRMYRVRNALVHAGQSCSYISSLVVNLHSYVDHIFTDILERLIKETHHSNLDKAYFAYQIEYEAYRKQLEEIKDQMPSEEHAKTILCWN